MKLFLDDTSLLGSSQRGFISANLSRDPNKIRNLDAQSKISVNFESLKQAQYDSNLCPLSIYSSIVLISLSQKYLDMTLNNKLNFKNYIVKSHRQKNHSGHQLSNLQTLIQAYSFIINEITRSLCML